MTIAYERVRAAGKTVEVGKVRITESGREALAGRAGRVMAATARARAEAA